MATLPPNDSIYDFIYLDLPRIRSYYAQMTGGVPNSSSSLQKTSESKTDTGGLDITGKGQIPFIAEATGVAKGSRARTHGDEETLGVNSDMIDKLPRDMITALDERKLIHPSLASENLGKLVLLKGYLQFNDLHSISKSLQPTVDFYMNHIASREEKRELLPVQKGLKEFAKVLEVSPARIQCYMLLESQIQNGFVWLSLDDKFLESSQTYSSLKYHSCSSEVFHVLGILDALPINSENQQAKDRFENFNTKMLEATEFNMFVKNMNEMYRKIVGRPENCYSVTPVSIFRELGVASDTGNN